MHNQMGVPLSYDFYSFMIITSLIPQVWKFRKENNIFTKLWEQMWYKKDLPVIEKYIQDHYNNYDSINNKIEKKKYMDKMQSIGELNKFLGTSSLKFKYDIEPFFRIAGINFIDDIIDKSNYFVESTGGKICYDKCFNGKCKTNKYSSYGGIYETDNCSEK